MPSKIKIVSHTRSGVHYLARLLHDNFETGAESYEELHYSHTRVPEGEDYIHLYRPLFPVMLSIWRCRAHLGIHRTVSFADMIRTPWPNMPRSEEAPSAVYNGEPQTRVCAPKDFNCTLPARWYLLTELFKVHAIVSIHYDDAVSRPYEVARLIAQLHEFPRKQDFRPVLQRVGWWDADKQDPAITESDLQLLESYQCQSSL
jgi:hypothetical protein